jgi:hypothetical protein
MDANPYVLERLVADRIARAHATAARRGLVAAGRRAAVPSRGRLRGDGLRARLGAALIALGEALTGDRAARLETRAGSRGG